MIFTLKCVLLITDFNNRKFLNFDPPICDLWEKNICHIATIQRTLNLLTNGSEEFLPWSSGILLQPLLEHHTTALLNTVWIVCSYDIQFSISQTQFYSYSPPVSSISWCDMSLQLQMCWSGGHCWQEQLMHLSMYSPTFPLRAYRWGNSGDLIHQNVKCPIVGQIKRVKSPRAM